MASVEGEGGDWHGESIRFAAPGTFGVRARLCALLPRVGDARVAEVVHEIEELFLGLDADEHQIGFPIVYANARTGRASGHCSRRCTPTGARRRPGPRS